MSSQLSDMLLAALEELGGPAFLVRLAQDEPKAFASLLAKALPAQPAKGGAAEMGAAGSQGEASEALEEIFTRMASNDQD